MNRKTLAKKTILIMTIFVYILSSLLTYLNEGFSIIAGEDKEETKELINTVAVFVDDKIYEKLQSDLEWYTTKYIQQEIP
ncbi:MAG: hypothetical protein K6E76_05500 [Patescibacteria group bacterium]|nr:hypothetical protein [Patescibacteria group bacterium]